MKSVTALMAIDSGGSPQPQDYFYYYLSQKLL